MLAGRSRAVLSLCGGETQGPAQDSVRSVSFRGCSVARKTRPQPEPADLETFEQVVKLIRKLVDERAVWVKIALPRMVEFVIDRRAFDSQVAASGLTREQVQRVLDDGLSDKLAAALAEGGPSQVMLARLAQAIGPIEPESRKAARELIEKQLAIINKHLITEQLRKRFKAKSESARDLFVDCEWQASQRSGASCQPAADARPTSVTLRFITQRGPDYRAADVSMLSFLFGRVPSDVLPAFDVDADELDYLIDVLQKARAACADRDDNGGDQTC